ncbi:MAG: lamin tail domain-containing protein [Anaerolineae bacterium]|nr:lamin tail domain-containing protein [Anaerolineae bacterium]
MIMIIRRLRKTIFFTAVLACLLLGARWVLFISAKEIPGNLVINEFVAVNGSGLTDEDGDYADWIEIYNAGQQPVNLSGWSLTDDPNRLAKWTFPDIILGSHEYLAVFASGKDRKSGEPGSSLHTNFKLNQKGEFLALYNILYNQLIDVAAPQFPPQFRDLSYGRYGQGVYGYLANPSPGAANDETTTWAGVVAPLLFSQPRGFYNDPLTLELSTPTEGATIRYTTDGSRPTETNGQTYTGPLSIAGTTLVRAVAFKPGFLPSYLDTHTYLFLDDVLAQPAHPPNFPDTWGIHSKNIGGYVKDTPVLADYEMDPAVVNDPLYRDEIREGMVSIPSLSIVTEMQNYNIYGQPRMRGEVWERPVSVELIYPDSQQEGFQTNAGLRIQGGEARWEYIPKHSFRLFFKAKYGATKLEYPLFPDSPVTQFDTLVLRGGTSRSYAGRPRSDQRAVTYTRDEWMRATQVDLSGVGSHGMFVHLYLNGMYWGLYNVIERPDASFASAYFGGDKDDWFAIKHGFADETSPDKQELWHGVNHGEPLSGSSDRYDTLHRLASEGNLADPEKYAALTAYVDIPQFIDFFILNWYGGRADSWTENNWYAIIQNPAGKIKYFVWDAENVWDDGALINVGKTGPRNALKRLFDALSQNPDFKMELADRLYKHLFNDGALTEANAQERWLRINQPIEQAIIGESARWGDVRHETPVTQADWLKARADVLAQMEGNGDKLIAQARQVGYYPNIDPPVFNQHRGVVPAGFNLTMTATEGVIYYTTDGSDPRLPVTGEVASGAVAYKTPLVLTATTPIKARVLADDPAAGTGQTWSALHEAVFKVVERESQLSLTEIMYNPLGGSGYEFVELKNVGETALNLAGMYFDEGIEFVFPPGAVPLPPDGLVVLVRNPETFAQRYPGVLRGGVYQGKLANQGEKIILRDAGGKVVVSVNYNDENGWPVSPDGRGDSLVLVDPGADPDNPLSWRASANLHGSPGKDEPALETKN